MNFEQMLESINKNVDLLFNTISKKIDEIAEKENKKHEERMKKFEEDERKRSEKDSDFQAIDINVCEDEKNTGTEEQMELEEEKVTDTVKEDKKLKNEKLMEYEESKMNKEKVTDNVDKEKELKDEEIMESEQNFTSEIVVCESKIVNKLNEVQKEEVIKEDIGENINNDFDENEEVLNCQMVRRNKYTDIIQFQKVEKSGFFEYNQKLKYASNKGLNKHMMEFQIPLSWSKYTSEWLWWLYKLKCSNSHKGFKKKFIYVKKRIKKKFFLVKFSILLT